MTSTVNILIPAHNEQSSLPELFKELDTVLGQLTDNYRFEVVLVDDGSTDGSVEAAKQYKTDTFSIVIMQFTRNFGKESAITAGMERCNGDAVVILDADLQHPPLLIPQMLEAWTNGYKVVEGIKVSRGNESIFYRGFAHLYYYCLRTMSGIDIQDLSDFKLLDREVILLLRNLPEKNRFFRGLVEWLGYSKYQVPFTVPERARGKTSWNITGLVAYSVRSLSAFSSAPLQVVTLLGLLMFLLSIVLGGIALFQWATGEAVTGFTTVILLILLVGSILMVSLGVIGLYVAKIYDEIKRRPEYVLKQAVNEVPRDRADH